MVLVWDEFVVGEKVFQISKNGARPIPRLPKFNLQALVVYQEGVIKGEVDLSLESRF